MKRMIMVGVFVAAAVAAGLWMAKQNRAVVSPGTAAIESAPAASPEAAEPDSASAPGVSNFDTPIASPSVRTAGRHTPAIAPLPDPVADERLHGSSLSNSARIGRCRFREILRPGRPPLQPVARSGSGRPCWAGPFLAG